MARALYNHENTVLQVRTGAGKTGVFLAASVAAMDRLLEDGEPCRLFLVCRTFVQVSQLYKALRKLFPERKCLVISSRTRVCHQGSVRKAENSTDACEALCKSHDGGYLFVIPPSEICCVPFFSLQLGCNNLGIFT